jgi:predicted nucleic acid-binding protein
MIFADSRPEPLSFWTPTSSFITSALTLLSNDALLLAVMQTNGLTNVASQDTDFDRVPGLRRYVPA